MLVLRAVVPFRRCRSEDDLFRLLISDDLFRPLISDDRGWRRSGWGRAGSGHDLVSLLRVRADHWFHFLHGNNNLRAGGRTCRRSCLHRRGMGMGVDLIAASNKDEDFQKDTACDVNGQKDMAQRVRLPLDDSLVLLRLHERE